MINQEWDNCSGNYPKTATWLLNWKLFCIIYSGSDSPLKIQCVKPNTKKAIFHGSNLNFGCKKSHSWKLKIPLGTIFGSPIFSFVCLFVCLLIYFAFKQDHELIFAKNLRCIQIPRSKVLIKSSWWLAALLSPIICAVNSASLWDSK